MKNKIILIFLGFITLLSCQQDDFRNETQSLKTTVKVTQLKKSDLQKHPKIQERVGKLNSKSMISGKNVVVENYGFIINTDNFLLIEDSEINSHSYTFGVYRDEDNGLVENLVLRPDGNGDYQAYLFQYDFSEEDIQLYNNGGEIPNQHQKTQIYFLPDIDSSELLAGRPVWEDAPYDLPQGCYWVFSHSDSSIQVIDGAWTNVTTNYFVPECDFGGAGGGGAGSGGHGIGSGGDGGSSGSGGNNGSGGGSGSGSGGNNNSNPPQIMDENGTIITIPVLNDPHIRALNKITNQNSLGTNDFRNKIDEYVGLLDTAQEENGIMYVRNTSGSYTNVNPASTDFASIEFPITPSATEVIIHFHHNFVRTNDDGKDEALAPVPSDGDIMAFAKSFYEMGSLSARDNLSSVVVTRNGLYAFRPTNASGITNFFNNLLNSNSRKSFINSFQENVIRQSIKDTDEHCQSIYCSPETYDAFLDIAYHKNFKNFMWQLNNKYGVGIAVYHATLNTSTGNYDWVNITL